MNASGIMTLTTDFGLEDTFVGQMKGAGLQIDPSLRWVDLTHAVPAGDIQAGAYALECGARRFPSGTVHVAVVDPGVGTGRPALLIEGNRQTFVGPDNGVLNRAIRWDAPFRIYRLEPSRFCTGSISSTFHGRDLFVPAAALYLRDRNPSSLGVPLEAREWPRIDPIPTVGWAFANATTRRVSIVHIDRFGNVVLDLWLGEAGSDWPRMEVTLRDRSVNACVNTFGQAPIGQAALLRNSCGYLEIVCNGQSAAEFCGLKAGETLDCRLVRGTPDADSPLR